ncbi:hypothetical protein [Halorussus aquaticus]|uniref:DUF357 domain-containing protein n=1 Tax=Halorussus aquaticus TaxID=2953748 RepID=A0ABD5PXX0_9EURY|nr:hypothetical protein [Halorussus aquaticus]
MGDGEPVEMPRQVYCEFETLGQMGVDVTDPDAVVAGLDAYDFDSALEWLLDNPEQYEQAVRGGRAEETTADP